MNLYLDKFLDLSPDLMSVVGSDGFFKRVNAAWESTLGWSNDELLARTCLSLVHPEDLEATRLNLERIRNGDKHASSMDMRCVHKDGTYRWLSCSCTYDPSSDLYFAISKDVTAYKERDNFLEEIQRIAKIGDWRLVVDTMTAHLGDEACRIHGIERHASLGFAQLLDFYVGDESKATFTRVIDECIQTGAPFDVELPLLSAQGFNQWVRVIGRPLLDGGRAREIYGVLQEITDKKTAQLDFERATRELQQTVAAAPGFVYRFRLRPDGSMNFDYVSRKAYDIYEVEPEDFQRDGAILVKMCYPEDLQGLLDAITLSAQQLSHFRWIGRIHTRSMKMKWVHVESIPELLSDGSILWYGLLIDISQQKALEKQLEDDRLRMLSQAKLASIGEMAAGIAHEINNPLAIIQGRARILLALSEKPDTEIDSFRHNATSIVATVDRIAGIVSSMRALARDDDCDEPMLQSVADIVTETLALCGARIRHRGIDLRTETIDSALVVRCQGMQLSQVLLNLLSNAADAVAEAPDPQDRWISIAAHAVGEVIHLQVDDGGAGVAPEHRSKLMTPFFTTKPAGVGTGLGLSISKRIIEAHGGTIELDETASCTRFLLRLPRSH